MRRSTKRLALSFVIMLSVFPFFTNCSEPMKATGTAELASLDTAISINGNTSAINEKALLSADQVLKSMSSVTGVAIDDQITSEYARNQDVLAGSFNLDTVTSPMLIGITNVAGKFCSKLVTNEQNAVATARKFFPSVVFTVTAQNMPADVYTASIQSMAKAFWGREATTAELASFEEGRTAFLAGRDTARAVTASASALLVFSCTGMLSSFDSFTF